MNGRANTVRPVGESAGKERNGRGPIVGIDFGTTNSAVAWLSPKGPEVIANERGERLTPSVVCFRSAHEALVGEIARSQSLLRPEQTVVRPKRRMGTEEKYAIFDRDFSPQEIGALILAKLKRGAEEFLKMSVERAVVTVPAYFDDVQRTCVLAAAHLAGLDVVRLLNEPTAAALAYGGPEGGEEERTMLVLDLGGGTFDITLLRRRGGLYEVAATGGSTELGGADFDDLLARDAIRATIEEKGVDLADDPVALQQLMRAVEKAKIDLSAAAESAVLLPYIAQAEGRPVHVNLPLSRECFERVADPLFQRARALVESLVESAGIAPDGVEELVFSGGSSRMPRFRREMESLFPHACVRGEINPDEVVVLGAALVGGIAQGAVRNVELRDVLPHSLGILDDGGNFVPLLERGTVYPEAVTRLFTNARDGQEQVTIEVLTPHGERPTSLGRFSFGSGRTWRRGEAEIAVTFAIDENGVLSVSAEDVETGGADGITIERGTVVAVHPHGEASGIGEITII